MAHSNSFFFISNKKKTVLVLFFTNFLITYLGTSMYLEGNLVEINIKLFSMIPCWKNLLLFWMCKVRVKNKL